MAGRIQSVERAFLILRFLSEREGQLVRVSEISEHLGLARTTVHGLLTTMTDMGSVIHRSGKYTVTPTQRAAPVSPKVDPNVLRSMAMPWVDRLTLITGLQTLVTIEVEGRIIICTHVFRPDSPEGQRLRINEALPLHASACGKAFLAFAPDRIRMLRNHVLQRFTPNTIVDRSILATQVNSIRAGGWALGVEEYQIGQASVAVPIRASTSPCIASVAVSDEKHRLVDSHNELRNPALINELVRTAQGITQTVGTTW